MDFRGQGGQEVGMSGKGCRALPLQGSLEDQNLILEFSKSNLLSFEDKLFEVVVILHFQGSK